MLKTLEKTAKTEDEAIAAALEELGMERDDVSVEIVERSKSGFLGIGAQDATIRVSYEVPDDPYAGIRSFLSGLLEHMGVTAEMEITPRDNGGVQVILSGEKMGDVIGRHGETLDAIQHLTSYAVNHGSEKRMNISIDTEGYRARQEERLVRMAQKMAARVLKYKREMRMEPMNSYERHVVHTALQDVEGVSTTSVGVEPYRRVVVLYERPEKPQNTNKPTSREWS